LVVGGSWGLGVFSGGGYWWELGVESFVRGRSLVVGGSWGLGLFSAGGYWWDFGFGVLGFFPRAVVRRDFWELGIWQVHLREFSKNFLGICNACRRSEVGGSWEAGGVNL